jgi:hypothetical protein
VVGVLIEVEIVWCAGWNEELAFWVKEGDVLFVLRDVPRGVVGRVKDVKMELGSVNMNESEGFVVVGGQLAINMEFSEFQGEGGTE